MRPTKKIAAENKTTPVASILTINTRVYDPDNLADVLNRLRTLSDDVKKVSADIAAHHRKHTRTHHTNGGLAQVALDDPVDLNPEIAARLHRLQSAIGEFTHAVRANATLTF